ncbi:nucleoporin (Nup54), putative [Bodo saltans]|uniref:Nucleoporin (Nup54), putative n=1 Tax=Bodo saltans TaxID=75058 RepID=A0A0S4JWT3_BODSA|nr:nucleoporin (Nup54), putative [Bodo saltans]|eukprot:CUG93601.1 nucleoporin (Nup54), putative [Bodo saltans]
MQGGFGAPAGGFGKAPVAGGFGAPAAGGFGAPAAGGFGAKAPAAPGAFGAAPAPGGFGAPAAGGFGAPAAGGFGAPAAGGFGKAPAPGGFGAPAAGGFGAPAAGGFGAPAAGGFGKAPVAGGFGAPAPGGFGAPAAGGFGAPAAGGFGAPQPPQTGLGVGGFGTAPPAMAPAAGTFGAPAAQPMAYQPVLDPTRQSTIVRYLLEIDNAYNALHPTCKFRSFVYNMCTPGLGDQAIARERYAAANAGGGCREEDWIAAQRANPDPENMYPYPVSFFQGLKQRVDKQTEMFDNYHKHMDSIESQVRELEDLQDTNASEYAKFQVDQTMLERRWMAITAKVETIRQLKLPIGEERTEIYERAQQMLLQLRADGKYASAASELDQLLDIEATIASQSSSSSSNSGNAGAKGGVSIVSSANGSSLVEPHVLKDWRKFLEHLQEGIERLKHVVDKDISDAKAAKHFLMGKQLH